MEQTLYIWELLNYHLDLVVKQVIMIYSRLLNMLTLNGKRVYAAINIYAPDDTYDEIIEQAKVLDKIGVDGIIASDGGVVE